MIAKHNKYKPINKFKTEIIKRLTCNKIQQEDDENTNKNISIFMFTVRRDGVYSPTSSIQMDINEKIYHQNPSDLGHSWRW